MPNNNTPIIQNLIISLIGKDQFNSLLPLFKLINDTGGNVTNSKFSQFGSHFVGLLQVDGRWDSITKIEQAIYPLESELDIKINCQRNLPNYEANDNAINKSQDVKTLNSDTNTNKISEVSSKAEKIEKVEKVEKEYLPYDIAINNLDEPGLLEKMIEFFVLQEIPIQELNSRTYETSFNSELTQINIKIKIPSDIHIPSLREQFDSLCYNENLDALLTPQKAI